MDEGAEGGALGGVQAHILHGDVVEQCCGRGPGGRSQGSGGCRSCSSLGQRRVHGATQGLAVHARSAVKADGRVQGNVGMTRRAGQAPDEKDGRTGLVHGRGMGAPLHMPNCSRGLFERGDLAVAGASRVAGQRVGACREAWPAPADEAWCCRASGRDVRARPLLVASCSLVAGREQSSVAWRK